MFVKSNTDFRSGSFVAYLIVEYLGLARFFFCNRKFVGIAFIGGLEIDYNK